MRGGPAADPNGGTHTEAAVAAATRPEGALILELKYPMRRRSTPATPCVTIAGLAIAVAASVASQPGAAQTETEPEPLPLSLLTPSDRGLRSDVAWLVDRGVLSLPLGTWPLPSTALEAASRGIDRQRLSRADSDALERVERARRRSTDAVRLAARVNSARQPALDGSDAARGAAGGTLAFYGGDADWGAQLSLGVVGDSLSPDAPQGSLDGSYLAVRLPGTVVAGGAFDRWWGGGLFTSPLLSAAARPVAGLIVRRDVDTVPETDWLHWIGAWGYEVSAGRLAQYTPDGTRTLGLRLYTRPWPNVEIGLSRAILWAGEGRPQDWVAFRNALLARSNIDSVALQGEDPSNEISGIDLRLSTADPWGGSWVGYLHIVGEDEAAGLPSKSFGTVGLQGKAVLSGQRLELTLEATDTILSRMFGLGSNEKPAPAYTHSTYIDGYYQNRLPIGANLGGGGYLYTLGLGWTSIDRPDHLRAFGTLFRGQASKTGPQPINAAFGQPASLSGLSLALEGEAAAGLKWQLGLSVQRYDGSNRPVTGLVAGIDIPIAAGR